MIFGCDSFIDHCYLLRNQRTTTNIVHSWLRVTSPSHINTTRIIKFDLKIFIRYGRKIKLIQHQFKDRETHNFDTTRILSYRMKQDNIGIVFADTDDHCAIVKLKATCPVRASFIGGLTKTPHKTHRHPRLAAKNPKQKERTTN